MEFDVVLMFTGMILVFLILVLLMFIISVEGKFFDSMDARNKAKADEKLTQDKGTPVVKASAAPAAAPVVEAGIASEIVAAIAAAVSALSGGKFTLRAVRRAASGDARGNWGKPGVSDVTAPF